MNWELAIWPDRPQYRPGSLVTLVAAVVGPANATGELQVSLYHRAAGLGQLTQPVQLDAEGRCRVSLTWCPPASEVWTAYGADATLVVGLECVTTATTALDIAPHWSCAPRYGFLTDFLPGQSAQDDVARLETMARLHLNLVQFYDWMYTHYDYIPPQDVYVDTQGKTLDFSVVRRRVKLCRERGFTPMAYGSVYGGEEPFADAHPEWLLYDGHGKPLHLGPYYIQDPSPDSGWRQYLLNSYKDALDIGFAGIHLDTYGSPKAGQKHDGRYVRLETVLPGLIADAQAQAEAADPVEGGCTFNNVGGWPVEVMAKAPGSALYLEVWHPDETYRDLYEIVLRMRRLENQRQPILAAYLEHFAPDQHRPEGEMAGLRLAVATIFASGGFHLLLGEGNGVLARAYYGDHGKLNPAEWEIVRAYWDFQTRYGPILADPAALDVTNSNAGANCREATFAGPEGATFSAKGLPGTIWTLLKEGADYRTVHLINLTGVEKPLWNSRQSPPPKLDGIRVQLEYQRQPKAVWWASPDLDGGRPQSLAWQMEYVEQTGLTLVAMVPHLHYWSMLVVED